MQARAPSSIPVESWSVRETSFNPGAAGRAETIFSLGNGRIGMRGNFEEGFGNRIEGTYINGFYEETPIIYGESAYGFAKNRQVMINVVDAKVIRLSVNGHPFDMSTGTLLEYERTLDLRAGMLLRIVRWRSPGGTPVEVRVRRLVSHVRMPVAVIDYEVKVLEARADLCILSGLNGATVNQEVGFDPRAGTRLSDDSLRTVLVEVDGSVGTLVQETCTNRLRVACAMDHAWSAPRPPGLAARREPRGAMIECTTGLEAGECLRLTKYIAYCTSRDSPAASLAAQAREEARSAHAAGFEMLAAEQREYLDRFWSFADVQIEGDDALQQGMRFNLAGLLQSAGRDGLTSLAAKGVTGEGYEGHYFWDTEIYAVPFFIYAQPEIARALLRYRCSRLEAARARAREMSQRGALFAWRTINGEEASPYFPAGTAQYHINADIVYAMRKYVLSTGDESLLREGGAEVVFETARFWADLGRFIPEKGGAFCIGCVTGPDEYTALVDNNYYTNIMARENLEYAVQIARDMRNAQPGEYRRIASAISLREEEVKAWGAAAAAMYLPVDSVRGINPQDDLFLARPTWDFAHTPPENYPLLLHYHYLVIYRHQVLKQPDVVLAQVLLSHRFSLAEKRRNFEFYEPLTTGDSSLSASIQCVAAAELGKGELAYGHFLRSARADLDDLHGNSEWGLHMASMAGSWFSLVHGFAGMRDADGSLSFDPRLPMGWTGLGFRLRYRSRLISVGIQRRTARFELLEGDALEIRCKCRPLRLEPRAVVIFSLVPEPRAVIFDLDGVITDTAEYHYRAWQRLCDEIGMPFDRSVNERLRGVGRLDSLRIILSHAGRTMPDVDAHRLAEKKNGYYVELIRQVTPRDLLPGIKALLAELRREGIKIALASASRNVWEVIRLLSIGPLIDLIVDPAGVVRGKPDPEIFFRAAEGLGVHVEDCIGIEDAQAGIEAIRNAGMFAVGVGNNLDGSDWRVDTTGTLTWKELVRRFTEGRGARP